MTEKIIGCAYKVSNCLGPGFLEKVYENAMCHEIGKTSLKFSQQQPINVIYDGLVVGEYYADLLVENEIVVELKAVKQLDASHFSQCMNYLKASGKTVGLLINFGSAKVEIRRVVNSKASRLYRTPIKPEATI
jgi:GxxExxY protein